MANPMLSGSVLIGPDGRPLVTMYSVSCQVLTPGGVSYHRPEAEPALNSLASKDDAAVLAGTALESAALREVAPV